MGFFSWKTSDTDRSISNNSSIRGTFPCVMIAPDGRKWVETDYEGYGVFGGKDFYNLVAELNNLAPDGDEDTRRDAGISAFFENNSSGCPDIAHSRGLILPKLYEDLEAEFDSSPHQSQSCDEQGFFYASEAEDEDEEGDEFWK